MRKTLFSSLSGQAVEHKKRSQEPFVGFNITGKTAGENLFRFLFSDPVIVGLSTRTEVFTVYHS